MADGGRAPFKRLEGRNGQIWRGYAVYRKTQEELAEEFGITSQRVSQIIAQVRASIPQHDLDEMRQQSIDFYRDMMRRAMEIADLVPAPLVAGADGKPVEDPENPGVYVRDYTGRLRAMETAGKFEQETRKLMGLDAAQKAEIGGAVRFEIVGVDTDDLT